VKLRCYGDARTARDLSRITSRVTLASCGGAVLRPRARRLKSKQIFHDEEAAAKKISARFFRAARGGISR
jgi:hypothetical protein